MFFNGLDSSLRELCETAGRDILAVRGIRHEVDYKGDGSPVTAADMAAHRRLAEGLPRLLDIPLLSEEQASISWVERSAWQRYWLVDPLDGTREFVDGFDDFTVNVALVEAGRVVLGVVHAPALGLTWAGGRGLGAWRWSDDECRALAVHAERPPRMLASRAHLDERTQAWLARFPEAELVRCGSSVKFCRIAEGGADLYPRFGPTCEWDTAAGQGVLEGAGGAVIEMHSRLPLRYNCRESLVNGAFLACSDPSLLE
ncbi:3'(2'),5'-bisphosphate nucleotidase CysQ [Halomonas sp. A29]|uniref:3'(2'),5'-bisphosphate nucleotidase CysQ n=1 Tax=Halomonas sp. A29 TaxID=3102786 RepID=UPI00398B4FA9